MAELDTGKYHDLQKQIETDNLNEVKPTQYIHQKIISSKFGSLLYYSESQKCIYHQLEQNDDDDDGDETKKSISQLFQKLTLTSCPLFCVTNIICSNSGNHLLLHGDHGIVIMELPRQWGDNNLYEGGKRRINCRSTILDKSFYEHHVSIRIIQAAWYPGSPNNSHIIVLTSDNCLRIYDISRPEQPMLRLPLFDNVSQSGKVSYSSALGETAAGFDVSECFVDSLGNKVYPVYVMQETGDVWVLHCKFSQNRIHVEQQGPLTMNPPSDDNYGYDYCSILCLPTSPTTLIMATRSGQIYHSLVIVGEEEEDEKTSYCDTREHFPTEALYVYESVRLELNFLDNEIENAGQRSCDELSHFKLVRDGDRIDSYISISDGGIHMVALPWVNELSEFLTLDDGAKKDSMETPAEIEYILCTKPSYDCPANAVCGCVMLDKKSKLLCLLSSAGLVHLDINRSKGFTWSDDGVKLRNTQLYSSPLRQLRCAGQFQSYISRILSREASIPVVKCGNTSDMIPPDVYYKLLTKTTQILREEYIQKMLLAKAELMKRCKILKEKKEEQLDELQILGNDEVLNEKGQELAGKLEQAQEKMKHISERVLKLFRTIQNSSPVLSNEEKEWARELNVMQDRVKKLGKFSEVVKTKHENLILQSIPSASKIKYTSKPNLPTSQAIKVRGVLKDQGSVISKLVEDVQELSLRVGV